MEKRKNKISVEVVFATPEKQTLISLEVNPSCTLLQAILQSGILKKHPEIDLTQNKIGIFGKLTSLATLVQENDRIEIYRPLLIDPKVARKKRA